MSHGTFVTAVNCMDGRVQEPVIAWMKRQFQADYVDMITEPGPDCILAQSQYSLIDSIRRRVRVSVEAHGSRVVAIVSHDDCAGNPVSTDQHLQHLDQAVKYVERWRLPVRLLGLFVNNRWEVELISDTGEKP